MVPEGLFVWVAAGRVINKMSQMKEQCRQSYMSSSHRQWAVACYQFVLNHAIRHLSLSHANHYLPGPIIPASFQAHGYINGVTVIKIWQIDWTFSTFLIAGYKLKLQHLSLCSHLLLATLSHSSRSWYALDLPWGQKHSCSTPNASFPEVFPW